MAGSAAGSKRKQAAPSDFKHIKAKVGKRAPKPANVTDTSFKAATLALRAQSLHHAKDTAAATVSIVVSSRGRILPQLATQLHHPAAAVRLSAIRGLGDAVGHAAPDVLQAHLSTLLPTVAKCCVDEDDSVRPLGLSVLKEVLQNSDEQKVRPFLPLVVAYVSSALHSLDRATRWDGGRAVEILSRTVPTLMEAHAATLLPAFVGLLSDPVSRARRRSTTEAAKAGKKRRKSAGGDAAGGPLQSLLSLLQTIPTRNDDSNATSANRNSVSVSPDLSFVPGGRTLNGLFISRVDDPRHVVRPASLDSVTAFLESHSPVAMQPPVYGGLAADKFDRMLPAEVAHSLISKLRDIYVEVTQRGHSGESLGLTLSMADLEKLALLVKSISLLWDVYCCHLLEEKSRQPQMEPLRKVITSVLSLMLESFPVRPQNPLAEPVMKCELLNADICVVLMNVGGYFAAEESSSNGVGWIDPVLDYLVPRLERDIVLENEESEGLSNVASTTVVDVISKLLLLKHVPPDFTLRRKRRVAILEKLCASYFADDGSDRSASLARSPAGRRSALLVRDLLVTENFKVYGEAKGSLSVELRKMVKLLPFYLEAWGRDFIADSISVVSTLHDLVRRIDFDTMAGDELVVHLRGDMGPLFRTPKLSTKKARRSRTANKASSLSIFESYPETCQRQVLGVVAMLQSPPDDIIDSLSRTCARASISRSQADYILQVVHSIRRTLSMKTYLGFIMNSIQLDYNAEEIIMTDFSGDKEARADSDASEKSTEDYKHDFDSMRASDDSIRSASRSLILCDTDRILPMISPLLASWLDYNAESSVTIPVTRFRAAIYILAMFASDIQSGLKGSTADASSASIANRAPELAQKLTSASCNLLILGGAGVQRGTRADPLRWFTRPVTALMQGDVLFAEALLKEATRRISDQDLLDRARMDDMIEALLLLIHNDELGATMRQCAPVLKDCCRAVLRAPCDASMDHKATSMKTATQILLGEEDIMG